MLASEASFLIENRVQDQLRGMNTDEALVMRVDAIMSALGVEDQEDLDELVAAFYITDDIDRNTPTDMLEVHVHPNDIVKVVRKFVQQKQESKLASDTGGAHMSHLLKSTKQADSGASEKRKRQRRKERIFWSKLGEMVDDKKFSVWEALETGLRKYNSVLEERAKVIDETTALARQNEELKVLLQEYLGSKINQELEIPPTRLIRVNNER